MVAKILKHKFTNPKADGADATIVRPSDWNNDHNLWMGRRTVAVGPDTLLDADHLALVKYTSATAVATTLPQAGAAGQFLDGWICWIRVQGAGTVTITPTTSTINGQASLVLAQGTSARLQSDGTNYDALVLPPVDSPIFTGDPKAPTPATADNDNSVATTAFVKAQGYAPLVSPIFTGNPQSGATIPAGDNTNSLATTGWVTAKGYVTGSFLPLAGGTLTGQLTIAPASGVAANLVLFATGATSANLTFGNGAGASLRWSVSAAQPGAESGSNSGSDFALYRYTDAGAVIDAPFNIVRSTGAVALRGTQTNDGAVAGNVGEYLSSNLPAGSASGLTNAVSQAIVSRALTAGDWDVWADGVVTGGATTVVNFIGGGLSTTAGASPNADVPGTQYQCMFGSTPFNYISNVGLKLGPMRLTLGASATLYMNIIAGFTPGSMSGYGTIHARRRR